MATKAKVQQEEKQTRVKAENDTIKLGPLTFNLAISRGQEPLISVSHTISADGDGGGQDITLILNALKQITADLQETLVEIRIQKALTQQKIQDKDDG